MPARRLCTVLCCSVFLGCLTAGSAAAATIHACVKKTSGVTRIVKAGARCRHGERALSWNTAGPKGAIGPAGASGAAGAPGANGAAAAFLAEASSGSVAPGGAILVSKVLPPGSYVVQAKADLEAQTAKAGELLVTECSLLDAPGTTPPSGGTPLDFSGLVLPLEKIEPSTSFTGFGTVSLLGSFSSKVTTTVDIGCFVGASPAVSALDSRIAAIQVSTLG